MSNNQSRQGPFPKMHLVRYIAPLAIIVLAIIFFLPKITSLGNYVLVIKEMSKMIILLAAVAKVCSFFANGYLLKELVKFENAHISILRGSLIINAAGSVGLVAGGWLSAAAATYFWVSKNNDVTEGAVLAGVMPQALNNIILTVLSALGMIYLLINHQQLSHAQIIVYSVIFFLVGLSVFLIFFGIRHEKSVMKIVLKIASFVMRIFRRPYHEEKIRNVASNILSNLRLLSNRGWVRPTIGAVLYVVFDILVLYLFFMAADYQVKIGVLISGYSLALLLARGAFFLPGGIGLIESSMIAIYSSLGVPSSVSIAVVLAYRLISFWIPSIIGFPTMAWLGKGPYKRLEQFKNNAVTPENEITP